MRLATILLFAAHASAYMSTDLAVAPCSTAPYQNWTITGIPSPSNTSIFIVVEGATPPTWCLDAGKAAVGETPHTWGCRSPAKPIENGNQNWQLTPDGLISSTVFKFCLAATSMEPWASIHLADCDPTSPNQQFSYDAATGHFALKALPSVCLDGGSVCNISCATYPTSSNPYCDVSLPAAGRAKDLISRWSLSEMASNLNNEGAGVRRLGAPGVAFGEALHGVAAHTCGNATATSTGCATSFPHALLMSSSFNDTLWHLVGSTIGVEGRALHNIGVIPNLIFWAPDINLFRDPRWGRGQEVPGECPTLTSRYVTGYSSGLQFGVDTRYQQAVSTAKHFFAYDLEGGPPGTIKRTSFNAIINSKDMVEYYLPAWRAAIQGARVSSIMCSYNAVNSIPSCGHELSMNTIAREEWGFDGFFVSDCGAVNDPTFSAYMDSAYANVTTNRTDYRVLQAMASGLDMNCGTILPDHAEQAVNDGVIDRSYITTALERVWTQVFKLGIMDTNVTSPYHNYSAADIDNAAHRALALEAAHQGMVLLKNDGGVLPLAPGTKVAVIGPHGNATQDMLSNYHGTNTLVNSHSPLQALTARGLVSAYAPGCDLGTNDTSGFPAALAAARNASVSLVFVGLHPSRDGPVAAWEAEAWDRTSLTLPGVQEDLIKALVKDGNKVVVVLIHGGPLAIEYTAGAVPAILDAHYPGELGGEAIADVVYGVVSPAGRLTTTVYPANFTALRNITDMEVPPHGSVPGVTYQWYDTPLWPFGFGLSYTTFSFQPVGNMDVVMSTSDMAARDPAAMKSPSWSEYREAVGPDYVVNVTNTGKVTSDVVVLGFVSSTAAGQPLRELFDFQRVSSLGPGEWKVVHFSIPPAVVASAVDGALSVAPGDFAITIGDGAAPARGTLTLTTQATVALYKAPF